MAEPCVFCDIVAGDRPGIVVQRWADCIAMVPINPVTPGHVLVIPRVHVPSAVTEPRVTGAAFAAAAELAREFASCNLITSVGKPATQSVWHLHVHVVPRRINDGLHLPWELGRPRG